MLKESNPIVVDGQFFAALVGRDLTALDGLLADDFILVDVVSGSENSKAAFLSLVGDGLVEFESIEPSENRVRVYQTTAIITGRTEMKGLLGGVPFTAHSRYTHVYVMQNGEWRMVTAQGTSIAV